MNNNKGQMILEAVLILTLLFGLTVFVSTQFKDQQIVRNLVQGPWTHLAGLIQNGSWTPVDESYEIHPNDFARHISLKGETP